MLEVGLDPEYVEMALLQVINELPQSDGIGDVLLKTAYSHLMFETIHSFADGNVTQRHLQNAV